MRRSNVIFRSIVFACVLTSFIVIAGSACAESDGKLKVGVYASAPFALKDELGNWSGISVDLWAAVAEKQGIDYDLIEVQEKDAVTKLANRELDVIAMGLPVRAETEGLIDFSQPFFASDWSIAVMKRPIVTLWGSLFKVFFSWQLWTVVGGLVIVLLFVGLIIWYIEGRENTEDFGPDPVKNIIYGLYWSVAMMTGAGEKAPKSIFGRLIAMTWIFAGLFVTGAFTASITTVLNVEHLTARISSEEDLPRAYVAVTRGECEHILEQMNVNYVSCADEDGCFNMLTGGAVDAVVGGEPVLEHYAAKKYPGKLDIIPMDYEEVFYAFGLRDNGGLAEKVNQGILKITSDHAWARTLRKYLEG